MNPFFSIIIVNYNYDNFIEQCINSVISQNEKDYELIIIDGGSSDSSVDIINKYKRYYKYFVSEFDDGQSHALNKGLNHACGDYIFWLNSDDFLIYNSLAFAKAYIEKNRHYHWFSCNTIFVSESNNILKFYKGTEFNKGLFYNPYINVGGPSSIVKKTIYDEVGFFNENLAFTMDSDMWIRISKANYIFKNINIYMWGFRLHSRSKTTSSHYNLYNDRHLSEILSLNVYHNINYSVTVKIFENICKLLSLNYLSAYIHNFLYRKMSLRDFEFKYFK